MIGIKYIYDDCGSTYESTRDGQLLLRRSKGEIHATKIINESKAPEFISGEIFVLTEKVSVLKRSSFKYGVSLTPLE